MFCFHILFFMRSQSHYFWPFSVIWMAHSEAGALLSLKCSGVCMPLPTFLLCEWRVHLDLGLELLAKCKTIVRFLSQNHFSFCGFTNQLLLLLHNNAFYADVVVQTIRKCDKRKAKTEWMDDHLLLRPQHACRKKKKRLHIHNAVAT